MKYDFNTARNNLFWTADSHFSHSNILKLCNRPFKDVLEMNAELIRRWNTVVEKNDTVFHLGDFTWAKINDHLPHLNGHIHFIIGNHDNHKMNDFNSFASVSHYREIEVWKDGRCYPIVMSHYPMRSWNRQHYGAIMLHGHCHGNIPMIKNSLDVGVDCWDYAPVGFISIQEKLATFKENENG